MTQRITSTSRTNCDMAGFVRLVVSAENSLGTARGGSEMKIQTRVPLAMFHQGGRRILIGRDDDSGAMVMVSRDREGYLLMVTKDPTELRSLLDNTDANREADR